MMSKCSLPMNLDLSVSARTTFWFGRSRATLRMSALVIPKGLGDCGCWEGELNPEISLDPSDWTPFICRCLWLGETRSFLRLCDDIFETEDVLVSLDITIVEELWLWGSSKVRRALYFSGGPVETKSLFLF